MNTAELCTSLDATTAKLTAITARLRQLSLKLSMRWEPAILPAWRKRAHNVQKRTVFMRSQMGRSEVQFLQLLLDLPDAITALRRYQWAHQRALQAKRKPLEAAPDVIDPSWRQRPARILTAEQMAEQQFSGRSLQRELRRIRRGK